MSMPQRQRLTFHVGLPKTGSTYLQQCVFRHAANGHYLSGKYSFSDAISVLATRQHDLLVSDEKLSWPPLEQRDRQSRRREQTLAWLASAWPDSQLLLFLREPSELIQSHYAQFLHDGGDLRFADFYPRYIQPEAFRFESLLDTIATLPFASTLLLDYQELRDDPAQVVSRIEAFTGVSFPGWSAAQAGGRRNVAASGYAAEILLRVNAFVLKHFSPDHYTVPRRILRIRSRIRHSLQSGAFRFLNRLGPALVSTTQRERIRTDYADSWNLVRERIAASRHRG